MSKKLYISTVLLIFIAALNELAWFIYRLVELQTTVTIMANQFSNLSAWKILLFTTWWITMMLASRRVAIWVSLKKVKVPQEACVLSIFLMNLSRLWFLFSLLVYFCFITFLVVKFGLEGIKVLIVVLAYGGGGLLLFFPVIPCIPLIISAFIVTEVYSIYIYGVFPSPKQCMHSDL